MIVSRLHVLTAAHCELSLLDPESLTVSFYNDATATGDTRGVTQVAIRPGVDIEPGAQWTGENNDDVYDINGKFADILVLTLTGPSPWYTVPAKLPIAYPGNNVEGVLVGAGKHEGKEGLLGLLRKLEDTTYSDHVNDGHFLVDTSNLNPGDSGGPFFTEEADGLYVHGVLFGEAWEWAFHGAYTSTSHHLPWILQKMSYTGGMRTWTDLMISGTLQSVLFTSDWRTCALACAQSSTCKAYNHVPPVQCQLLKTVTSSSSKAGVRAGPFA